MKKRRNITTSTEAEILLSRYVGRYFTLFEAYGPALDDLTSLPGGTLTLGASQTLEYI